MRSLANDGRVAALIIFGAALLFCAFFAWRAVSDIAMQRRNQWEYHCADDWLPCVVFSLVGLGVAYAALKTFRRSAVRQRESQAQSRI
jgi:hypothetical protein